MAQIVAFTADAETITGTIRDHSEGDPERFSGFNLARSAVTGEVTEIKLASALGIELTDPDAPVDDRVRARNPDGTFRADDPATPDIDEAFEP